MYKHINRYISYYLLALSAIFIILLFLTQYLQNKSHSETEETINLSSQIDLQSVSLQNLANKTNNALISNPNNIWEQFDSIFNKTTYDCFASKNNILIYWNTNKLDIDDLKNLILDDKVHVTNLPTGWYLYTSRSTKHGKIFILDLIRPHYGVNNELLTSKSNDKYKNISNIKFTTKANDATNIIYGPSGSFLLGTSKITSNIKTINGCYIIFILYLFAYVFLILFIFSLFNNTNNKSNYATLRFSTYLFINILIRFFDIHFNVSAQLCNSQIFTTEILTSPLSQTIGDLFFNACLLVIFSITGFVFFKKNKISISPTNVILKYTAFWAYTLISLTILFQLTYAANSSLYTEGFLNNDNSIFLFLTVLLLNIGLYYAFISYLNSFTEKKIPFLIPYIITFFGVSIVYLLLNVQFIIIIVTIIISFLLIILKQLVWKYFTNIFLNHILILTILATISSIIINDSYKLKDENYQVNIAQKLSTTNDLQFENSFKIIITNITNDDYLTRVLTQDTSVTDFIIEEYLKSKYFRDILNKYDIQITNCGDHELIEIQPEGEIYDCADYFNSLIAEIATPVIDSTLFQFKSESESIYYIARIPITNNNLSKYIYIEFISSHVPEGLGYAELLIDKQPSSINLSEYSFAKYLNNHMTYKFGDYAYSTYYSFTNRFKPGTFYISNNYKHYSIQISESEYIIVSKELTSKSIKLVTFSIIFIILALLSIIIYIIVYAKSAFNLLKLNFKTRLQTFVIATLTLTFILVAITTLIFIQENNRSQLEKQLAEKANSVLIELQHKLSSATNLESQDTEFLHQLLRKFSLVFFSDINLYDKSGYLVATSRPEIFKKKLLSTYINPKAYRAIFFNNKLNYFTQENIGNLDYYSAYVPLNLNNDFPIGVVNLPYFARQTEFAKSYYIMLSYLINIYVIIGIIGALIAIIFSRYLTRPLVMLQKSLATIRIDKHNEKIGWNKKDEIGMLIHEYNHMVDKLEHSAELLIRSERESAWREVARQIAHEIKNPLTPMKLNVQYLQKSFINNDPEFSSKINSISKSLIEQIDTLDNVAEMFSDFAKSKSNEFMKVNLLTILNSSVNLFNKNENVNISLKFKNANTNLFTMGFEKDILRAINNILTNAIQSIDKNKKGEINIIVQKDNKFIKIAISDNGKGIPEDMKIKIFQPYFTTKTSGTGLGLAIVKNIMTEIGGEVYFESKDSQSGTTFNLVFPEA